MTRRSCCLNADCQPDKRSSRKLFHINETKRPMSRAPNKYGLGLCGRYVATLLLSFQFMISSAAAQSWGQGPPPRQTPVPAGDRPRVLEDVRIDQRLNESLPLDAVFRDENGNSVHLGEYFKEKPVVLALVYYSCPMLCNQVLNGLASGLDVLKAFSIGREFEVVTVSFDPREGPELARQKKATYLEWYKREGASDGWHFLTGDQANIDRLTEAA